MIRGSAMVERKYEAMYTIVRMRPIRRLLLTLGTVLCLVFGVVPAANAYPSMPSPGFLATAKQDACNGIGLAGGGGCGDNGAQVNNAVAAGVNVLSIIVGIVAVIMLFIAGLNFTTSNGEAGKVTKAKHGVIYALVGLIIVAFAETLVHFVLGIAK
jgi:hypothetical protein